MLDKVAMTSDKRINRGLVDEVQRMVSAKISRFLTELTTGIRSVRSIGIGPSVS